MDTFQSQQQQAQAIPAIYAENRKADMEPEMKVSREEMAEARLPLHVRDHCAHMLIPLNECRRETAFLPFKCEHERHEYEKCQYLEFQRRKAILKESK